MINKLYDFKNLKGDFSGGLVAGIVALPLALAFGGGSPMCGWRLGLKSSEDHA